MQETSKPLSDTRQSTTENTQADTPQNTLSDTRRRTQGGRASDPMECGPTSREHRTNDPNGSIPSQDGSNGLLSDSALLNAEGVAAFLNVHVKTIHRWRRTLGLPCVLVGGRVRFFPSEVIRWVSARKEG